MHVARETDRRPFHETIVEMLDLATQERSNVAEGVQILVLTRLLNKTEVPYDQMISVADHLEALAHQTEYKPAIKGAAENLRLIHARLTRERQPSPSPL